MSRLIQDVAAKSRLPVLAVTAFASAVVALTGCSTRNDTHFNPYRTPGSAATVMQRADSIMDAAEDLLDNLDARVENAIR